MKKIRRDIRISISRKNTDMFGMCQTLKVKGYSPSNFICIATREKFMRDVKIIPAKAVLLPPQQQKPEPVIRGPRVKTPDEIREEQLRQEAAARAEEERKRHKAQVIADIKEYMKS